MAFPEIETVDQLKAAWTDKLVRVKTGARPELQRFEGKIGRVVTVNYSGRVVLDFADGAWYDLADFQNLLEEVIDDSEKQKFDATANSAQPYPARQS